MILTSQKIHFGSSICIMLLLFLRKWGNVFFPYVSWNLNHNLTRIPLTSKSKYMYLYILVTSIGILSRKKSCHVSLNTNTLTVWDPWNIFLTMKKWKFPPIPSTGPTILTQTVLDLYMDVFFCCMRTDYTKSVWNFLLIDSPK